MAVFRRDKTIKNERPTIAVATSDTVQHSASTLLANIRFSSIDSPVQTISFTSSVPNEGKTTIAFATAVAVGKSGQKCLVVEGDMRRRSLRALFNVKPRYGIHALITGQCSYQDAICATSFPGVYFLDAEMGIPNPDNILASRQYRDLLGVLKKHFHYIIIDTPPITAFPDAALTAAVTDGAILVVRENHTDKRDIGYSLEQLRNGNANVLGTVLNCQDVSTGGYGYSGHYYNYYSNYTTDDGSTPVARHGNHGKH